MARISTVEDLQRLKSLGEPRLIVRGDKDFTKFKTAPEINIRVCRGSGCTASGSGKVTQAFEESIKGTGLEEKVRMLRTGCHGLCEMGPIVIINPGDILYNRVKTEDIKEIVEKHLLNGEIVERLVYHDPVSGKPIPTYGEISFYLGQERRVLHNNGLIDPWSIEEYIVRGGYQALAKVLTGMRPEEVIQEVNKAGLRGRGGAGFPTARKWGFVRSAPGEEKYIVCNGDEGDPGAYMNRSVLEGNPHSVIEGMVIGAYAIGNVRQGYAYVRAEYPLAIETLSHAIAQAREYGLLGRNILSTGFEFSLDIFPGAGAFVCGEETALLGSIEGKRGNPRQRPPFPANKGLFGKPTTINNVETWSDVPQIILMGADWFASVGTERSKGTKTFSLVGKINNTGLVEVPLGTSLRKIVFDIGGGIPEGKRFKGVQIGGPSGGVIPTQHLDVPVDYEAVTALGAIMGSGGLVVMDEDSCMVDVAKFFLGFTKDESCGKCTPCRAGIPKMLEILIKITQGKGAMGDLDILAELGEMVASASLCGLGQTAPNPALSTVRHFREEYEAHIIDKRCPAGVCKALVAYHALEDKCLPCLETVAGYDAGGYEAFKAALPELVPERLITKLQTAGCAVDLARFSMTVPAQNRSCTKCPPCRLGIAQMVRLLDDIATGNGNADSLDLLLELSDTMKTASECPVGKTAPNIVLFTLQHFRDQFEEHILDKRCSAGICQKALSYHTICPLRAGVPT